MADELGYYASGLSPEYSEHYNHELFEETLNDWGWFGGLDNTPRWFTGGMGCHGAGELPNEVLQLTARS